MNPSVGIVDATMQRLIDIGLSGVAIIGLVWFCSFLWKAREAGLTKIEEQLEKRIAEQTASRDAVVKAIATLDAVLLHDRQGSHQ